MGRLASFFMMLGSLLLGSPALSAAPISEAEFGDIETSCSAEIAAYNHDNPSAEGRDATIELRTMLSQFPNDRQMLLALADTLRRADPKMLAPTYICAATRRAAQIDGAALLPRAGQAVGQSGPLELRGALAPSQSGALAPDSGDRYFLKGILLAPDNCSPFCPRGGVKIEVVAAEPPNQRLTGGMFPGEFGFGDPMKSGTGWHLEVLETTPTGLYSCDPKEASGIFGGTERATNVAGATEAVRISCALTTKGWEEVARLRSEKEASDELLLDQARNAVRDILAKAKAGAAAGPTIPMDSGLSEQTSSAIDAGRAAADGAISAGNSQVMESMLSIQQQAVQQQAERQQAMRQREMQQEAMRQQAMRQQAMLQQPIRSDSAAPVPSLGGSNSSAPNAGANQLPPPGADAHVIASNGRSATDCVSLERITSGAVAGRALVSRCPDPVEISWCYSPGDCDTETGGTWPLHPGRSLTLKSEGEVRWAACHGANTIHAVKYSHGQRYYCTAPI